jgi:hypothetical protein
MIIAAIVVDNVLLVLLKCKNELIGDVPRAGNYLNALNDPEFVIVVVYLTRSYSKNDY